MRRTFALLAALTFVASTANAQTNSASVNATATVLQPLNIALAAGTGIDFGNVYPGTAPAAIAATSGAKFTVAGHAGAEVNFVYTLPATLAGATLGWSQCIDTNDNAGDGCAISSAAPSSSALTFTGNLSGTGAAQVWLGASLGTVPANQAAGAYSATVDITVNYTGN